MRGRRFDNRAPSPYPRTARVNKVLREVVADALERLADTDDRLRLATVTSVDTAPDLRHATVYLSSMSDDTAEALAEQRVNLQREIGRQVRLKRTPLLAFAPDPAVAHGLKVEDILRRLGSTSGGPPVDGPPVDGPPVDPPAVDPPPVGAGDHEGPAGDDGAG